MNCVLFFFTINGSLMCATVELREAMRFYNYLNEKIIVDSVLEKLDKACDGKLE